METLVFTSSKRRKVVSSVGKETFLEFCAGKRHIYCLGGAVPKGRVPSEAVDRTEPVYADSTGTFWTSILARMTHVNLGFVPHISLVVGPVKY